MFRAQPGVIWLDIVMSKYYRHSLRRHLIKLHPRNDQITIVRRAIQMSFLHFDDDIHKKIDRRACQAKQPRVDAICGRKWWLSHSCHHQCDGSIVCPTGAVVLSRLFVHSGETLFVTWFVRLRKLVCLILSDHGKKQGLVVRTNLQKVNLREPFRPWPQATSKYSEDCFSLGCGGIWNVGFTRVHGPASKYCILYLFWQWQLINYWDDCHS